MSLSRQFLFFFFFNDTATTEIYTLSLHDALPISGFGISNQRDVLRLDYLRRKMFQRPATAERTPGLEMRILQTPLCQGVARPFVGALCVRRRGQTGPDDICQIT